MDDINNIAMKIILYSGDARLQNTEAIKYLLANDFDKAENLMKKVDEKIIEAHRLQTNVIQNQIEQQSPQYNILFSHAQDTLMTIYSEINLTKQLIKLFANMNNRITKLEQNYKD